MDKFLVADFWTYRSDDYESITNGMEYLAYLGDGVGVYRINDSKALELMLRCPEDDYSIYDAIQFREFIVDKKLTAFTRGNLNEIIDELLTRE